MKIEDVDLNKTDFKFSNSCQEQILIFFKQIFKYFNDFMERNKEYVENEFKEK